MKRFRIFYQIFFLVLFCALFFLAAQGKIKGYPVTLFLDSSPLNGISVLLSSWNIAYTMWIGFAVLGLTFFIGRFFCSWVCPLGTIFNFVSLIFRPKSSKKSLQKNSYSSFQIYKYILLIILLTCAALGVLQAGLFDPISLLTRTFATFLAPAVENSYNLLTHNRMVRVFPTAPIVVGVFVLLLLLNAYRPRFWCRYICPLGALLGCASKFSIGSLSRDENLCIDCGLCKKNCQGASCPNTQLKTSECLLCWNCVEDCPQNAISWQWIHKRENIDSKLNVSRRNFFGSIIGGAGAALALRSTGTTNNRGFEKRIRPPGALHESEFLARCIKCGECVKVCPTNVIQPAFGEAGVEGFMTPILDFTQGYCELNCTLCGQVCPTGAIQKLKITEKTGYPDKAPLKTGTAFVDRTRCIPWSMDRNCVVCQEVCPVSPKAIYDIKTESKVSGKNKILKLPQVDPSLCIGCGLCQHECPVHDLPAIRITPAGESRSHGGGFYL